MGARTRRANLAVPRNVICDLDARHAPHGTAADYVEFARAGDDKAKAVYGRNGPKVRSSVGGHQKVGSIALAWRDHFQGKDEGVWTSPDVAGARFLGSAKPGQSLALAPSTTPGEIVVKPCSSKDQVPACVALREVKAGKYGPVAFGGVHWFPGTVTPAIEAVDAGEQLESLMSMGPTSYGFGSYLLNGSNSTGPLNAGQPTIRVLAITEGWWLGHVIIGAPEGMIRNEWDTYNNHAKGKAAEDMMAWHLWGDPDDGKHVGLGDQLLVVDGIGEPATLGNKIGESVTVTHLSLRLGARFYAAKDMKGPIQFLKQRVPPGWTKAPLYYDGPKASGEIGSWVPAFPPPETKPNAKPPTTTETPKPPKPPTTPKDDPIIPPPPGGRPKVTTEPGDAGPTLPPLPGADGGLPPLPPGPDGTPTTTSLAEKVKALGERLSAAEAEIENINETIVEILGYLDAINQKLAALEAAAANAKSCGAPPNSNSTSGGGASTPGGNGGGGNGSNVPAPNNPPNTGAPAPTGGTGGPHAGGVGVPRGPGQTPTGCGGNDTDPGVDDSLCSTTVDPDPFPSAASGGLQYVPGNVGVPGAALLNHPGYAGDSDGPAFTVYADRAGQLWTTVDGMGGSQVKLTWDPDSAEYFLDLWQTDYRPVSGPSQTENFVAGLASEFGMTLNRHGQVTDYGALTSPAGDRPLVYSDGSIPGGNTVANTATTTAFASSYTIPANELDTVGMIVEVECFGVLSTDVGAPTLILAIKVGSVVFVGTTTVLLAANLSNVGWSFRGKLLLTATGASGTMECHGTAIMPISTSDSKVAPAQNTSPLSIDTTATNAITVTAKWNNGVPANTITLHQMTVEIKNLRP